MEKKLMTSKSYSNWEKIGEPFEKNGRMYQNVKEKCPRCGGCGIIVARVENDQLIPIPVDNGVCYLCKGAKYVRKTVRLYTESEYNTMQKNNERARQKKEAEREAKMKAEFACNKAKWLEENGFNENEVTYVYAGADSYQIKDELKDAGFRFSGTLKWHKATRDEKYANNLIEVKLDDLAQWSAWGKASFNPEAKSIIEKKIAEVQPKSTSTWVGEVGERLKKIPVTLIGLFGYEGKYGYSQVVKFQDENGNVFTWFTATNIPVAIGDSCLLTGTVKKLDTYKDEKTTILTRCRIEA